MPGERPRFGKRRAQPAQPAAGAELRWIGGLHAVEETLQSKPASVREVWIEHEQNSPTIKDIIGLARRHAIRVQFMSRGEIDRATSGGRNQGVAAKVIQQAGEGFFHYLKGLTPDDKQGLVIVALDQIQDPHNLGAIARSAVNLGARGLILPDRRSSPVTAAAVQASAGAIQRIPVYHVVNLGQALDRCRDEGFWIYGADAAGKAVWDVRLIAPMVLVIGSEGSGMRPLTRTYCHELLAIPQSKSGVDSLNASCAASVMLYEIARQMRG